MKFVQEYCTICRKDVAMPVIQEDESHPGLVWVRCPVCREVKPMEAQTLGREDLNPVEAHLTGAIGGEARDGRSRRVIRHYRSGERFLPGEWIYHPGWDDTGQIIEKCRSPGGHDVIVVAFEKVGTKRLVSNFAR